ncbi:MAG: MFS transporter [Succinivibrio sp.]
MAGKRNTMPSFEKERKATYLVYIAGGIVIAPWSAIVPAVKLRNAMPDLAFALMSVCFGLGAVVAMACSGLLVKRFGFKRMSALFIIGNLVFMTALSFELAPEWSAYPSALLWGAVLGGYEVSINIHASSLETRSGRPLITSYTAVFTVGCVASTLCFPVLMGLGMRLDAITLLTGLAAAAAYLASMRSLGDTHGQKQAAGSGDKGMYAEGFGRGALICAGAIAGITYLAEGTIYDWSGVYLTTECGFGISLASVGYLAYEACLGAVRYASPLILRRFGTRSILIFGAAAGAAAMLLVAFTRNGWAAAACCGIFGLCVACHVPSVISETGRRCGPDRAAAIGIVSSMGYTGVLLGPALMGFVAMSFGTGVIFAADAVLLLFMSVLCARFMGKGR